MTIQEVKFEASTEARDVMIGMLEHALDSVRQGATIDLALVRVERGGADGPEMAVNWYGESHFASLLGGVVVLQHGMVDNMGASE